jgi:NADH-quinone oxidoreductase subunit C
MRKDFPLEGLPSDMPDVGFTKTAPMADGPFVTSPGVGDTVTREPRSRRPVE